MKITSMAAGPGELPKDPRYLGPFMPWASWRHMPDRSVSIVAYLRHAVKPVSNKAS